MRYCKNCRQRVTPIKKNFNVLAFIILLILGIVPGLIYILYHLLKKEVCPMCHSRNWGTPRE